MTLSAHEIHSHTNTLQANCEQNAKLLRVAADAVAEHRWTDAEQALASAELAIVALHRSLVMLQAIAEGRPETAIGIAQAVLADLGRRTS